MDSNGANLFVVMTPLLWTAKDATLFVNDSKLIAIVSGIRKIIKAVLSLFSYLSIQISTRVPIIFAITIQQILMLFNFNTYSKKK